MGLSNKKSVQQQKTTQTENVSTTKTNPSWVTDALSGFTGKVTGLLDDDPQDYVAGVNPLQAQAGEAAAGLGGWREMLKGASAGTSGASLLQGLDDYMSPYRDQVVDATLDDFDADAGRTRAAQAAGAARNGAFGGSRYAIREAQTEGELARGRATAEATLLDQMFNTGAGLSNLDAGRRQQAEMANADRAMQAAAVFGENERADAATQLGIGGVLRGIEGEQKAAPLGLLGSIGGLLGQGQFGLFNGSDMTGKMTGQTDATATEKGGLMGQIMQAAQLAATVASLSDARLKTDVQTLGRDSRGRRWATWRYLWEAPDAPPHVGVMAQEIRETDPDAVLAGPLGFLAVDYRKLEGSQWQAS